MQSTQHNGEPWDELRSKYAQHLAAGVGLPPHAAQKFSSPELAVLGAVRDVAYNSAEGACSLTVNEIARLAEVRRRTAVRAITIAIAAGIIDRDGCNLINRRVHYKIG